jgi:hypothetical protein
MRFFLTKWSIFPEKEVLMKYKFLLSIAIVIFSVFTAFAQVQPTPTPTRPRVIVVGSSSNSTTPTPTPTPSVTPTPTKVIIVTNTLPSPTPTPISTPRPVFTPTPTPTVTTIPTSYPTNLNYKLMSLGQLKSKVEEAKRLMQSRPMPTALTESFLITDIVRVAFYDWKTAKIDFVTLTKVGFLTKDAEIPTLSANGKNVSLRVIRANGVNTPVMIYDTDNQAYIPLVVQYPVERNGSYYETAYYISTHPGVVTPEVVNAGRIYVRNTIDVARTKLQEKGIFISPQIADIAERLATVEHVDHLRFRTEYHPNIFNDIFTLYAMNEGTTYRYSVSSAGAGGMVQMIPSTYFMIRSRYYNVGLIPDFVEGMRNHVNASQAMLLYMQMTWDDIGSNETVINAIANGTATQPEIMAAGYNSNPSRLPAYIRRGGSNWRALIPNETKIYLQIYSSINQYVPMTPRTK